jgi:hypothetical protein
MHLFRAFRPLCSPAQAYGDVNRCLCLTIHREHTTATGDVSVQGFNTNMTIVQLVTWSCCQGYVREVSKYEGGQPGKASKCWTYLL